MKKYLSIIILVFCIAYVVIPLFGKRFIPTHDGEYHIIRFWEFDRMLSSGQIIPQWASDFDDGFGSPVFMYQYILPNYLGVFYHRLGFSYIQSFTFVLLTGYLIACVSCFFWLRKLFSYESSVAGTAAFIFVPYWFVDVYIRGSVGEVLAIGFATLSFAAIEYNRKILIALSISLLILSHNISAMVFVPLLCIYSLIRYSRYTSWIFLGFGLASFFWIPALLEQNYVTGLNTVSYQDHFVEIYQLLIPSWGTGFSGSGSYNQMSFQIGIVPLVIAISFFLMLLFQKSRTHIYLSLVFTLTFLAAVFLTTSYSSFLWKSITLLSFVQHPWRFLMIIPLICAYFTGSIMHIVKKKHILSLFIVAVSFVLIKSYARPVTYEPRDDRRYINNPEWTTGTSTMGNTIKTIWEKKDTSRKTEPLFIQGSGVIQKISGESTKEHYAITAQNSSIVQIPINYFPGWEVYINNQKEAIHYETNGLIRFTVQSGISDIHLVFMSTPTRLVSRYLSIICLLSVVASGILENIYASRNRHHTT